MGRHGQRITTFVLMGCMLGSPFPASSAEKHQQGPELLKNSRYAEALLDGIRGARKSIICSFFLFKTSDSPRNLPRRIAEELVQAKKRGVEVTVILEQAHDGGPTDDNRRTAGLLSRGGVKVVFDSPSVVTHTKAAVIDRRYVYLGSHNLTQSALRYNNELSVMLDSPQLATEVSSWLERLQASPF